MPEQLSKKRLTALVVALVLIITLHYTGILRPIENGLLRITNPVIRFITESTTQARGISIYFRDKEALEAQIGELQDRLQQTQKDIATRELLEEENEQLRSQLAFSERSKSQPLITYVVGKTIDRTSNTVIIGSGSSDGIAIGNPVIIGDGILIGTVAKVSDNTAVVRLINDPQSRVAATVLSADRSIGLIEGGFGVSIFLTMVPQTQELAIGDLVVTSGLEEGFPRGLLIGTITSVEAEDYAAFKEAVVEPSGNLSRLSIIGVIRKE